MSRLDLPQELRFLAGLRYDKAFPIEYQNVHLEDVLPGIFYVARLGRRRGSGDWEGRSAATVAGQLAERVDRFSGWDDPEGKALLEGWLKASVLRMSERTRVERVLSVAPLHFMTYRVDLPFRWDHLRFIPEFVAAILSQDPAAPGQGDGREPFALATPDNLFWRAFGGNLRVARDMILNAELDAIDESLDTDIESLLAVRLAELLGPPREVTARGHGGAGGAIPGIEPLCPGQARQFREDFSLYLRAYGDGEVPLRALADQVLCLLSLNLTTYSLAHVAATNHLYATGEWLSDNGPDGHDWNLGIYADLTGGAVKKSRELARQAWVRHFGWLMQQVRVMLGFRLLERYLSEASHIPSVRGLRRLTGIEFLSTLTLGRRPDGIGAFDLVQAVAARDLGQLRTAQPDGEWPPELTALAEDGSLTPFDRLVELVSVSDDELRGSMGKFLTSITRRNEPSGLSLGAPRRQEDAYTLGVQQLETLVHLLVLRRGQPPSSRVLDVTEFVYELRKRYGIWVDAPPPGLDQSYEAHEAAQANLAALKERLRQLGFLRSVTDARRMQWLRPLYVPAGDRTGEGATVR